MSTTSKTVPMGQKIAFGMGMLANQMFPASLGIFMVVLVQNLGFPGWMWGMVYFLPRVLDAVTDPIMGFISDNTKSVWGRRKQYVFLGAIVMGVTFSVMWQLYGENSVNYNFTYFLLCSFGFYIGLTIFSVPYVAMGYEMSEDFHERTQIMAIAQWIGQWAWVIAPWFWVIMYEPSWFPSPEAATRQLSIWVGVIFAIFAMVPAIFIPSKSTKNENFSPLTFSAIGDSVKQIIKGFKEAFSSRPFRKLCISTFFIFNAFNTVAGFVFFIVVWHLFSGDAGAAGYWTPIFGSVGALVTTFIVIPIVAWMSKKIGKKNAFMVSQGIALVGYASLWFLFVPGKPWMFIFSLPFHSFGIGSLFVLMMSMTADVIDLDELNYGVRREGVFGAIYWYMVKFGFAIAGGLSGLILTVVGFDGNAAVQPEGAVEGLRLFFSGLPMLGTIAAMYLMHDYDVDENRANEIRAELEKRKAEKLKPENIYTSYQEAPPIWLSEVDKAEVAKLKSKFEGKSTADIKAMFAQVLEGGFHGLCFSPYLQGQNIGDTLSEEQIRRRMEIIAPHTQWVRSFSCTDGNELIPKIAREKGLKTMIGAWLGTDKAKNKAEIEQLILLAKAGLVDIAVVGNEVLLRGELTEAEVLQYLKEVKQALPDVQVSYVDTYFQLSQRPDVVEACDLVLANCYPFWEGCSIDQAPVYLQKMHEMVKNSAQGKEVIITETGWPDSGEAMHAALPSPENAMKYLTASNEWAQNEGIALFNFSSFDEPWKVHHEGEVGQSWGIWNKNETLKY
ncbi:glycoside/pentoside/hexuronide:cation symporter, GPH family [Algoriphagus faecimaris]|uniref:Endo-1,3-beta-glucanase btgC n=1 Tax=Algoriphagus faecimaris TaxID=686796 RepID=A0A1G6PLM9_9BACT|nr:MFS transporter [Algoriphagus faecimaris]SDC80861.1 glycoside/pentoside/hexuronide:cation symporter, GPH family [Algoriphagus faecimaris]